LDHNNINIVCYAGGTCGDLISAIIDPYDVVLNTAKGTVILPQQRIKLKKPHQFNSDTEKDWYIQSIPSGSSISSHDLDYHVARQHQFVSITVKNFDIALWAAQRFKNLHRSHVWKEMQDFCGANTVEQYAQTLIDYSNMVNEKTDRIVPLENIVSAKVIFTLETILNINVELTGQNFYQKWLKLQQL
jgi:hypothetical protein